jgi:hypothetical protein
MEDGKRQCAHEACHCTVGGNDIYCSEHCTRTDETQREESQCRCGHSGCANDS